MKKEVEVDIHVLQQKEARKQQACAGIYMSYSDYSLQ